MRFLYRYVFRGLAPVLVLTMFTLLWTACNYQENRAREANAAREAKAKEEAKRILDAMQKDADKEIRKYTDGNMQAPQPQPKETRK
jgi:hypothetical protein